MTFTRETLITAIAHTKVIIFYGAESVYPFFTLFTAVGIAKIAFGIPTYIAIALMVGIIGIVGITTFKTGVFGKDLDIKWNNTASAKKLCEQVDQLCREGKG
jgi:hypothetical protein